MNMTITKNLTINTEDFSQFLEEIVVRLLQLHKISALFKVYEGVNVDSRSRVKQIH